MRTRNRSLLFATALATLWIAHRAALAAPPAEKAPAQPPMDEKAAMEVYIKAGTPGPEHQEMAKLAGNWTMAVTSWMAPGAPPEKSTGSATFETIFGGRYLKQTVKGTMGGQPFDGLGFEGFDNVSKERFGIWMDSMSTGTMITKGKCAAGAKTCTMKGTVNDALTGKATAAREVLTKTDDNSFTFDMYGPDPQGKEFHMMQIVYRRQ